ncbi:uncharacterized protein PV09_00724 [Verruconis gallopava]|uniref:EF-hand domain-containing protein n=1 Tax=Verruconis gallopava TaxID=253628 RepID=A0A0D2AQI7_9PEZI|nr:uncharacterized protein PV09_00724 [Verruconis gallopava]KIW08790.1 hypothetical protein PV09_00724 [Verruconis gallopava]
MSNPSSPLRPAPLSFARSDSNGRMSPFRRPESPLTKSPSTVRAATPQGSPLKQSTPSRFSQQPSSSASSKPAFTSNTADDRSWIHTRSAANSFSEAAMDTPESPTRSPRQLASSTSSLAPRFDTQANGSTARPSYSDRTPTASSFRSESTPRAPAPADPLSSIPPQYLHTMRESFAVLDRANTGFITQSDLVHQLNELGLDASPAALSQYFPPGSSSLNLSSYLHLLSADLTRLTSSTELMDAFSTFDVDDSGQIDVQELKEALLSTMPEPGEDQRRLTEREVDMAMEGFTGRRAFKKGAAGNTAGLGAGDRRPVFRYGDFVKGIWGVGSETEKVEAI